MNVPVSSWGRLDAREHQVSQLREPGAVPRLLQAAESRGIAYGMGRSYGDVALNPGGTLWMTAGLDRFVEFDPVSGRISCEAGVLLRDIQLLAAARGWMLAVTPGTWWVTVGGAIANDVHGKNHHVHGTFGDHVLDLTLARSDGGEMHCSAETNSEWLAATIGGLGLTGIITRATLQLRRVEATSLTVETLPYQGLGEFFQLADDSERDWEYTVSWVDCLSGTSARGIFMRANHALSAASESGSRRRPGVPFVPPFSLVNRYSLSALNNLYYHWQRHRAGHCVQHYESFFYPLDSIRDWNRIYGPRGFYQYQCVLPAGDREATTGALMDTIARSGQGSFLVVLKTFGERAAAGMLSFPRHGVTLALDFPNRGKATLDLLTRLDGIVAEAGGRLYPAKDARMPRTLFTAGYPRLSEFVSFRDPALSSALSRRLLGD